MFICKKWEGRIYTHKVIFRKTWQALERSGEAKEWVRSVCEGERPGKGVGGINRKGSQERIFEKESGKWKWK